MSFEADLKAHLAADTAIAAQVGERITPQPLAEGGTKPAITYAVVADAPQTDLDGADGELNNVRVQIDCWAATHDAAKSLAELVRVRMKTAAATFHAVPGSAFEDYEPVTKLHRMTRDFSCWWRIT